MGYPGSAGGALHKVTINTLQTHKFLFAGEDKDGKNRELRQAFASYKVTTLNRELHSLLDGAEAVLKAGQ
jgi:hypothetical protein